MVSTFEAALSGAEKLDSDLKELDLYSAVLKDDEEAALSGAEKLDSDLKESEAGALYSVVLKDDEEAALSGAEKLESDLKELEEQSEEKPLRLLKEAEASGAEYCLEVKELAPAGAEKLSILVEDLSKLEGAVS